MVGVFWVLMEAVGRNWKGESAIEALCWRGHVVDRHGPRVELWCEEGCSFFRVGLLNWRLSVKASIINVRWQWSGVLCSVLFLLALSGK